MSTRTRLTFDNHDQWLQQRSNGIGASEIATVVGLNPWESPYQLWRRKVGIDPPKAENFAMKAGHYLEEAVSRFWADATGNEIIKSSAVDFMFIDKEKPFLQVSPDRLYWLPGAKRNDDNKGILECKTTQMKIDTEDLPLHWFCQLQMNLGVAGYQSGSLAWLSCGRDFGYKDIEFVPDFYATLVEAAERFWTDNVKGGVEPEATTAEDVIAKYTEHVHGKVVEIGDDMEAVIKDLKQVKAEISEAETRKAILEEKVKLAFGDAEALMRDGQTFATWKAAKPSTVFDHKRYALEHPDLCKSYMKVVPGSRRLLIK